MKKIALIVVGLLIILMGILALVPGIEMATEPVWHAFLKIIVGVAAIWIGCLKEPTKT